MDRERGRPTEEPKGHLGKILYRRRLKLKLTQPKMAEYLGVSRRQWQRMEKGHVPSDLGTIRSLMKSLKLGLEDFKV